MPLKRYLRNWNMSSITLIIIANPIWFLGYQTLAI